MASSIKLFSAALPKGTGGRKPAELNSDLYDALEAALRDTPTVEVQENGKTVTRSQVHGLASLLFDSEGKASADGRRYARPIAEALSKTVRVRVVDGPEGTNDKGDKIPQYGWVLYIPLANVNGDTSPAQS